VMTGAKSAYRKYAPFLRRRDEQKAHAYDMYGPPRDCKGEVRKKKVSLPQMYPAS